MNTPRAARRRSIVRALSVTRSRLQGCDALAVNATADGVGVCGRIATARQEFVAAAVTFRCGTHRVKPAAPGLVSTQIRTEGFARVQAA